MIRTEHAHLTIRALTHPGMTGKNNEDRFGVSAYRLSREDPTPVVLAVLADGIGGHRAGEVAAEMVVEAISRRVAESDGSLPTLALQDAVTQASRQVYTYAQQNGSFQGMGATCACALIIGNRLYMTAIGDSRIYLMRDRQIRQLTTDHTWIQEALDKGLLKPEQVRGHPNAHVIRRFVGSPTPPEVDLRLRLFPNEEDPHAELNQGLRLLKGDRLLLCSDGLTDLVQDREIEDTFQAFGQDEAAQKLVDLACERGGHDNITLVAIEVPEIPDDTPDPAVSVPARKKSSRQAWLFGCSGVLLAALLLGLAYALYQGGIPLNLDSWGGAETPVVTHTLPGELQTLLPGQANPTVLPGPGEATSQPAATATPAAPTLTPTQGPTYTPWPTATLLPVNVITATPAL